MKKHLTILAMAALALTACSKDAGKSAVDGTLVGAEGKKVYMDVLGLDATGTVSDSAEVRADGTFTLRGIVQTEPTFYNIRLADGRAFTVLLDSAEVLTLKADGKKELLVGNVTFDNSPRNENLQKVMVGASGLLSGINASGNRDSLMTAIRNYKTDIRDMVYADPRSMVGYYAILQTIKGSRVFDVMNKQDHQLLSTVATSLQIAYPNSKQVKHLCDYILAARAQQKANARRDSLLQSATELNSPDLNLPDINGDKIKLSSLRGKTVLLYFWASNDENSRKVNQQLAKTYDKFKSKNFEIYAVSFDTSKVLWESASKNDYIKWINVCDLQGYGSATSTIYNVQSIPSNYILDPDGRIIGKDLFGSRLDEKLSELLK